MSCLTVAVSSYVVFPGATSTSAIRGVRSLDVEFDGAVIIITLGFGARDRNENAGIASQNRR